MAEHATKPATQRTSMWRTYATIYAALMLLLAATVAVAYVDLGRFVPGAAREGGASITALNAAAALAIAFSKAILVVLFFMHVRYSSRLIWLVAGGGFVWLAILIGLTLSDYLTRDWLTPLRELPGT